MNVRHRWLRAPDLNLSGGQPQHPAHRADADAELTGDRQLPFAARPRSPDSPSTEGSTLGRPSRLDTSKNRLFEVVLYE